MQMWSGTTLIVGYDQSSLVMAVDDLGHAKDAGGEPAAHAGGLEKLFILDEKLLIGVTGLLGHVPTKYQIKDWVAEFIETHYRALADKNPFHVAAAVEHKARQTFSCIEALPDDEIWKMNPTRGAKLISYIVAGYCGNFPSPYIYEVSAELDFHQKSVKYHAPFQCRQNPLFLGNRDHVQRALIPFSSESAFWQSYLASDEVRTIVRSLPSSLQKITAWVIGLIKVEAKFNGKYVGPNGRAAIIEFATRKPFLVLF